MASKNVVNMKAYVIGAGLDHLRASAWKALRDLGLAQPAGPDSSAAGNRIVELPCYVGRYSAAHRRSMVSLHVQACADALKSGIDFALILTHNASASFSFSAKSVHEIAERLLTSDETSGIAFLGYDLQVASALFDFMRAKSRLDSSLVSLWPLDSPLEPCAVLLSRAGMQLVVDRSSIAGILSSPSALYVLAVAPPVAHSDKEKRERKHAVAAPALFVADAESGDGWLLKLHRELRISWLLSLAKRHDREVLMLVLLMAVAAAAGATWVYRNREMCAALLRSRFGTAP